MTPDDQKYVIQALVKQALKLQRMQWKKTNTIRQVLQEQPNNVYRVLQVVHVYQSSDGIQVIVR